MNHFAEIIDLELDNEHKNVSILISETIDSIDCVKSNHYPQSSYRKFANIGLAIGLIISPCALDQLSANNRYNSQIESEWSTSCAKQIDLFSRHEDSSLSEEEEEEEISTASSFYEDFIRVPAKSKRTIKVNVKSIKKGRPSRI